MKDLMFQQQQQQQQQLPLVEENMSHLTSASGEATASSGNRTEIGTDYSQQYFAPPSTQTQPPAKKKRNLPGNPDPEAEVVALSPKTLLATNRFICEICNKGFQRDQNLQLHRRGHNLPWKLKQRTSKEIRKKVYVCPEATCVHHDPSRALGDLTGIKKHFCRKHGEKKWKCDKCSKKYAVQSDWKAHSKTCGTREYRCDCGTLFSRRDSFITHRAFCDALAEESARGVTVIANNNNNNNNNNSPLLPSSTSQPNHHMNHHQEMQGGFPLKKEHQNLMPPWLTPSSTVDFSCSSSSLMFSSPHEEEHENPNPSRIGPNLPPFEAAGSSAHMSATALLQKAAEMGATMSKRGCMIRSHENPHVSGNGNLNLSSREHIPHHGFPPFSNGLPSSSSSSSSLLHHVINSFEDGSGGNEALTRDFLGLTPLSHTDILNFAAMPNCINSSSQHNQSQNPWQG